MRGRITKLQENKRTMGIARRFVVLSLFALFVLAAGISLAASLPSLTSPMAGPEGQLQTPGDRLTVDIDFSLINPDLAPVAAMSASVPGRTITILKDRILQRGANDYSWFGTVEGQELSTAILTVVDGKMHGHIDFNGESFSISPGDGGYVIIKDDPLNIPPFENDALVGDIQPAGAVTQPMADTPLADDGAQIDLLVLYTPQMQTVYGSGLASKIQSLVDYANQAYTNSFISTQLRLVGTILYSNASAVEGISTTTALNTIKNDSSVGTSRNLYSADLVTLMRVFHYAEGDGCGLAWINKDNPLYEQYGFSVVKVGTDGSYYCHDNTLVHELGHNMGCDHNRAITSGFGAYPYSFGYDNEAAGISSPEFGTIMSYVFPSIAYFSTPLITYSGVPIGVTGGSSGNDNPTTSADNARTINLTRVTVSSYRASVDTTPPPAPINLTATPVSWTNINNFSINWTNPSDSSNIAGAWYKVGAVPTTDTDGTYTTSKPFNAVTTAQNGQTIYVWLQDGAGNRSRTNLSLTTLYYDSTAPTDGTLTATKGNGSVSLSWNPAYDTGGSGLSSPDRYIVKRNTGSAPNAQCTNGTQVYLGTETSTTASGLSNGQTYYFRVCAYDTAGNISQGATASSTLTVNVQFNSSPTGRAVIVDSVSHAAPWSTTWSTASTHPVNVESPQTDGTAGKQYVFSSWSDGGAQGHSIAPVVDTAYTATFLTQYEVTTNAGSNGTIAPDCSAGCWQNSDLPLQLTAIPDSGYVLSSWGGNCAGTDLITSHVLDGPKNCSASFSACGDKPVQNSRTNATFDFIGGVSNAYASADSGDTLWLIATTLGETLDFDRDPDITITLQGGYGCGYSNPSSLSVLSGPVTLSRGTLIMDSIIIK